MTPSRRRATAALALTCLAGLAATGCSSNFNAAMSKREVVVLFAPDATRATQVQVRASCANVNPRTTAEPMPKADNGVNRRYGVRFRVDQASEQDLNALYACLKKNKSVVGVNSPDDDN